MQDQVNKKLKKWLFCKSLLNIVILAFGTKYCTNFKIVITAWRAVFSQPIIIFKFTNIFSRSKDIYFMKKNSNNLKLRFKN